MRGEKKIATERRIHVKNFGSACRNLRLFFCYEKDPGDNINSHIGKLEGMRADLLDLDFEIDEDIFLATIIGSLPAEYAGIILQSWEFAADEW